MNQHTVRPLPERFWPKVNKAGPLGRAVDGTMSPCWAWTGAIKKSAPAKGAGDNGGYGVVFVRGRGMVRAHRVAWALLRGPIDAGLYLLHSCDNRACVNPDHMRPGTHDENMAEMVARGRHWRDVGPCQSAPVQLQL